jgi:hypothetical protein
MRPEKKRTIAALKAKVSNGVLKLISLVGDIGGRGGNPERQVRRNDTWRINMESQRTTRPPLWDLEKWDRGWRGMTKGEEGKGGGTG